MHHISYKINQAVSEVCVCYACLLQRSVLPSTILNIHIRNSAIWAGHRRRGHSTICWFNPVQFAPPFSGRGLSHDLVRKVTHLVSLLHGPQSDQADQPPSTALKAKAKHIQTRRKLVVHQKCYNIAVKDCLNPSALLFYIVIQHYPQKTVLSCTDVLMHLFSRMSRHVTHWPT